MKISLTIPDETFEVFVKAFGIPGCYAQMRSAVEAFKGFSKDDRYLIVFGDARRAIEATFQTTVDTPEKLALLVKNLSSVAIQGIDVPFTSDELLRIDAQAGFHGKTRDELMREMITEIKRQMLELA